MLIQSKSKRFSIEGEAASVCASGQTPKCGDHSRTGAVVLTDTWAQFGQGKHHLASVLYKTVVQSFLQVGRQLKTKDIFTKMWGT